MKIFVITAHVELTEKPSWLDKFRQQYDKPYEYHTTLKQPCYIKENQVPAIKNILGTLLANMDIKDHAIPVTFNALHVNKGTPDDTGITIMIDAPHDTQLRALQKQVTASLTDYKNYYKPKHKIYEEQFMPHITIARDLDEQTYLAASKKLEQDYTCRGSIKKVILTIVDNFGPLEANDRSNQTIFEL